jgi:ABC-type multidrug transport system fused ATPase/permease subunit
MDWGVLSQITFFLSVALLAVVVTIFVFASSLLGRAVEAHRDDQEKLRNEEEELLTQRREELQKKLQRSVTAEDMSQVREEIEKLEAEIAKIKNKSESIEKSYEVFGVKGGVVYPSLCFIASSVLSGFAWSFEQAWLGFHLGSLFIPITPVLWFLALLAMGWGIERLYLSLRKIQEVAVTSEEAALKRTVEAFKTAQTELEEKKRPKLFLFFKEEEPPFSVKAGSTLVITFKIRLIRGDVARKPVIAFFVPEGFAFLNSKQPHTLYPQPPTFRYPKYLCISLYPKGDYKSGVNYVGELSLQTPPQKGNFTLAYRLLCESFVGEYKEFAVVVQ